MIEQTLEYIVWAAKFAAVLWSVTLLTVSIFKILDNHGRNKK